MPRTSKKSVIQKALGQAFSYTGTHHGSSRWSEHRRCPYGAHLRYTEGVQPIETPDYFRLGSLVHGALAYAALMEMEHLPWDLKDVFTEARKRTLYTADIINEARRLLSAYFAFWGTENAGYGKDVTICEVEHFVSSTTLGLRYTGRVDTVLELDNGLMIVDHKTRKSMPGDDDDRLISLWGTNPQFLGLSYCMREIEKEIPTFCVNIITKTKIPNFRRVLFKHTDGELDEWAENHRRFVSESIGTTWKNYSECSPGIGMPCWAFDWCHGTDQTRRGLYLKKGMENGSEKRTDP